MQQSDNSDNSYVADRQVDLHMGVVEEMVTLCVIEHDVQV